MIRWGLRLRVFLFFALIVVLGAAAFGLGLQLVASRQPGLEAASLVPALLVGAIGLAAITLWVWFQFDLNVARPILGLARAIETRAHADVAAPVETAEARYLGPLGAALRAVAAKLAEARRGRAEAMAAAAAAETAQKARLEAVIQRVEEAVIVCSMSHHVLLANDRAAALLGRTGAFGLGRPLDRILTPAPLNHALDRLSQGPAGRGTLAVCTTADGATLLQCRIALIPGQGRREPGGYVLTVADVTEEIEAHAERDRLLSETLETSRRSAANLTALLDALAGDPAMEAAARAHFESCLRDEARALSEATRRLAARAEAAIARHWPMAEVPAWDILNSAAASMPGISMVITEEIAVTCDSLTLVNLLRDLAGRLGEGRDLVLSATPREPHVLVDLAWEGTPVRLAELDAWLAEPIERLPAQPTGQEVLARHQADLWPDATREGRPCLRLALPAAGRRRPDAIPDRPEFYDFDLAQPPHPAELDATPLARISFVVFDTETTGLQPSAGDEVIQLAAVRVVNGRVLRGETFDALVNPGRPIPPASSRVHGLTDADVAGAPPLGPVFSRFREFAHGAVLVAHNAAFDLAFLRKAETRAGRLDQPVLDTVFLSAFLHDHTGAHNLDALAARFGVAIDPTIRHTALGDALATAEIFVKLLPALRARGIETLGQALAISEEMHGIRRAQARY